ncbi:LysR family transcriptional regulator [Paenibacillus sp. DXFW5]|jgi:LysR family transcriptional regulator, transcription activator of glutamate synthase operon|uniref:LysR family transcriptional regulator n=1 Tax=Paenibacillus rhizolycopersici TaxID=2780073 RepID=A0ABS2H7N4_9BACL|nr:MULTISPECIES: LysR family transcriptional regulator [Paenibacillus]MBM6996403.1 LysR family transcriptional regulator [Paenibacillus rhizolycopersici]GIP48876.1 hyaluronan synthase [Paenibacillus sp. J53TS2]
MNLEQLEYIVDVAKTKSLTKTAQNAHVTLSAVSQSISLLESELGVVLFNRSRGVGAVPTPEGQSIIGRAAEILTKLEALRSEANSYSDKLSGELIIATIPGPMHLLMEAIAGFRKDYPEVKVRIFEQGPKEILDELQSGGIDLGFIALTSDLLAQHKTLHFEKLFTGKMVVGVPKTSLLALERSMKPEQLVGYSLVLYDDEHIRHYLTTRLAEYGEPDILFATNNVQAIQGAVREGLALTVGVDYSFESGGQADIVPVELDLPDFGPVYYGWVIPKGKQASAITKCFIRRIQ